MATIKAPTNLLLLFFTSILATLFIQGFASQVVLPHHQRAFDSFQSLLPQWNLQGASVGWRNKNSRRMLIGSTAPTCTYNECRGCKFKCRAEQIPVDANDPINSAYHYKCVCHR